MAEKRYFQGRFRPKFPEKYKGDPTKIYWRSSWELQVMKWLDGHSAVVQWSSEETIIPYKSPIDRKFHRYFPDFQVVIARNGIHEQYIVEVKPKAQTKPPKMKHTGRPSKAYVKQVETYLINSAKFEAAKEYCDKKGYKFMILTEDNLKKI